MGRRAVPAFWAREAEDGRRRVAGKGKPRLRAAMLLRSLLRCRKRWASDWKGEKARWIFSLWIMRNEFLLRIKGPLKERSVETSLDAARTSACATSGAPRMRAPR